MMRVKDLMTPGVITIAPATTIQEAETIMKEKNIRRLIVVEQEKAVGIIVHREMIISLQSPTILKETPVEWIMTKNLITIQPDAPITEAIQTLRKHKINSLPVVEDDNLVGIITVVDLLHELTRRLEAETTV
ncbi:CBS domain-containing protein [Aneurinibacillus aneurinilyticus]|uniref:CBS domain protein n=1 Tax=Aneurinibacillus aneurinilyticus ATCC 12856 TaxID=649747 RepID=U1X1V5_ANEAE|nr:CBS domain-containing protein [Aneurinibacillus aneurinilyticus]ERI08518.1 CBS domain protein [Aneurinibacillus aneurinilyticus ATCC 12856]MED0708724.1 CBS domain-containing protein [Aneurinibacillus aneurinilyticus]MED0724316.1 CBS domain-containing protein [Aneurinibacillus aneurinilyticus]MED0734400.1 CBS domain-containing protein [Aneurinibacillus aneurinilyticus]MED0739504.1 CBS domain-containing protein [Aneurinibacillus aneurinilyticus]